MTSDVNTLILSKSLALIEKTKRRVSQIDGADFPTISSEDARRLLMDSLAVLGQKKFWQPMSQESLYKALVDIQQIVEEIEASTCAHISWPLVSYCDHIWNILFPKNFNFAAGDLINLESFVKKLKQPPGHDGVSKHLSAQLSSTTKDLLDAYIEGPNWDLQQSVIEDINRIIQSEPLFDIERFANVRLSAATVDLQKSANANPTQLNQMLLLDAFPGDLIKSHNSEVKIFYSVTTQHNYRIGSFTTRLKRVLCNVLTAAQIDKIINNRQIYCLQLASLEEENLPLYANIGHEFGHALIWQTKEPILGLDDGCDAVWKSITEDLKKQDPASANRRSERSLIMLYHLMAELYCDLIGSLIAGPAFFLSLQEMSWGPSPNNWIAKLTPLTQDITAYPSFKFRLDYVKRWIRIEEFEQAAEHEFKEELDKNFEKLTAEELKGDKTAVQSEERRKHLLKMASYISTVSTDHALERFEVFPKSDDDAKAIQQAFTNHLKALKAALGTFLQTCYDSSGIVTQAQKAFPLVSAEEVAKLMRRLANNILPNVVPDGSLLAIPASFSAILNASAFYRIAVLTTRSDEDGSDVIYKDIQKVERLTAKAFEVSYIQKEFNAWQDENATL